MRLVATSTTSGAAGSRPASRRGVPTVDARDVNVFPVQRRHVLHDVVGDIATAMTQWGDGAAAMTVFQCTMALTTRLKPEAWNAWLSNDRSWISPRS